MFKKRFKRIIVGILLVSVLFSIMPMDVYGEGEDRRGNIPTVSHSISKKTLTPGDTVIHYIEGLSVLRNEDDKPLHGYRMDISSSEANYLEGNYDINNSIKMNKIIFPGVISTKKNIDQLETTIMMHNGVGTAFNFVNPETMNNYTPLLEGEDIIINRDSIDKTLDKVSKWDGGKYKPIFDQLNIYQELQSSNDIMDVIQEEPIEVHYDIEDGPNDLGNKSEFKISNVSWYYDMDTNSLHYATPNNIFYAYHITSELDIELIQDEDYDIKPGNIINFDLVLENYSKNIYNSDLYLGVSIKNYNNKMIDLYEFDDDQIISSKTEGSDDNIIRKTVNLEIPKDFTEDMIILEPYIYTVYEEKIDGDSTIIPVPEEKISFDPIIIKENDDDDNSKGEDIEDNEDKDIEIPNIPNSREELEEIEDNKIDKELNKDDHISYLEGYEDNTIRPDDKLSREEAATVLYRILDSNYREDIITNRHNFPDVKKGRWSEEYIATLVNGEIIEGYKDGNFRPESNITRAELATLLTRFYKDKSKSTNNFIDTKGHWAEEYINIAYKRNWIKGYKDNSFRPDKEITRAEFTELINNVLERKVKKENILDGIKEFEDLNKDKWYYEAMIEAINGHEYRIIDGKEIWTDLK